MLIHIPHRFCTFAAQDAAERQEDLAEQIESLRQDAADYRESAASNAQITAILDELQALIRLLEEELHMDVTTMSTPSLRSAYAKLSALRNPTPAQAEQLRLIKARLQALGVLR